MSTIDKPYNFQKTFKEGGQLEKFKASQGLREGTKQKYTATVAFHHKLTNTDYRQEITLTARTDKAALKAFSILTKSLELIDSDKLKKPLGKFHIEIIGNKANVAWDDSGHKLEHDFSDMEIDRIEGIMSDSPFVANSFRPLSESIERPKDSGEPKGLLDKYRDFNVVTKDDLKIEREKLGDDLKDPAKVGQKDELEEEKAEVERKLNVLADVDKYEDKTLRDLVDEQVALLEALNKHLIPIEQKHDELLADHDENKSKEAEKALSEYEHTTLTPLNEQFEEAVKEYERISLMVERYEGGDNVPGLHKAHSKFFEKASWRKKRMKSMSRAAGKIWGALKAKMGH